MQINFNEDLVEFRPIGMTRHLQVVDIYYDGTYIGTERTYTKWMKPLVSVYWMNGPSFDNKEMAVKEAQNVGAERIVEEAYRNEFWFVEFSDFNSAVEYGLKNNNK